jgi:hypothetical protein
MKNILAFLILVSGFAGAQTCDASLWKHVYHHNRLTVIKPCVTVTGVITFIRREKDGDLHTRLKLDLPYEDMINHVNAVRQKGNLVLEPMCTHKVSQADAQGACKGFHQAFPALTVGSHVRVTGAYVLDHERGHGWREIHPVSSIERIR